MKPADLVILVDSREQRQLRFRNLRSERATLPTADYSVRGPGFDLRDTVLIERKSVVDLVGSLGVGRARFEREMVRLAKVRWKALVVEGDLREIAAGTRHSGLTPKQIMGALTAFSWKYQIAIWAAPNRAWAARIVELLLYHASRYAICKVTSDEKSEV